MTRFPCQSVTYNPSYTLPCGELCRPHPRPITARPQGCAQGEASQAPGRCPYGVNAGSLFQSHHCIGLSQVELQGTRGHTDIVGQAGNGEWHGQGVWRRCTPCLVYLHQQCEGPVSAVEAATRECHKEGTGMHSPGQGTPQCLELSCSADGTPAAGSSRALPIIL